jgi:hypothetical protein
MCDNWYENMDNGKLTEVVFLYIKKAIDSIDYVILLEKLTFYGVSQLEIACMVLILTLKSTTTVPSKWLPLQ